MQAADYPDLASAIVRGSSVYSAPELFGVYSEHLSRPISAESARAIATAIAAKYSEDGYSRPQVTIDDRMAAAGILAFDIVETRISTIDIAGDAGPYADELQAIGRHLHEENLLQSSDLQSTVGRMRDLAGLSLSATTERDASVPGAYRLRLDTEFRPVSGTVRLSNRGTDEIGPGFLLGQTTFNGLASGRATAGLVFGTTTSYTEYHGLGVTGAYRPSGTQLSISASGFRSRSDPREQPVDRDVRYLRDRVGFAVGRPVTDSAQRRLMLSAGLRAEDLAITRNGFRLRDERLRLIELSARLVDTGDASRQHATRIEIIKGLDGMGSGLNAIDIADDPRRADLTLLLVDYVRVARINARWTWRLNALGQLSNDVLSYSERFKIGGNRLGRGFEVAEIAGDSGLGAKVEVLRRLDALSTGAGDISFYATYDLAAAWKNNRPGRESAATGGLGLALSGDRTSGRIEFAKPLTHPDVEGREDLSVFLELSLSW